MRRLVFGLVAVAAMVGFAPTAAHAKADGGLTVAVRTDNPLAPVLVLTNTGATACRVAATTLGTTVLTVAEQGGTPIVPIGFEASFDDGLDHFVTARLRTLDPGASVELPLRVVPLGPTGHALETVAWSPHASLGSLYPVREGQPLRLEATYSVPTTPEDEPALCAPGDGAAAATTGDRPPTVHRPAWLWWALAGFVAIAVLVPILLLVWRRRRAAGAGFAVLVIAAGLVGVEWSTARPAHATITVDPSLASAWAACSGTLHGPGGDPAGILPTLEAPGVNVQIVPANGDETHEGAISPTQIFIFWDTEDRHPYFGSGGNADPCTSLYHELYHAYEDARGGQNHAPCVTSQGPSGLPINEVEATRAQNKLRAKLGLKERSHYGRTKLPDGDCLPPERQPRDPHCTGDGCADSNGDPHLMTFDGRRYDFQAVGEFVATVDPAGGFQVQVRQQPVPGSRLASVNTAIAMDVAGDRVEVRVSGREMVLLVGGAARPLESGDLPNRGTLKRSDGLHGPVVTATWPDGSVAGVAPIGRWGLHLTLQPAPARGGKLQGLFGDFDGDSANDIRPRGGQPVERPTFAALYPSFADSWRIDASTSLFTYPPGTGPESYVDRTFPDRDADVDSLPNRAAAEGLCRRLGVTDPETLRACVLDVALTGAPEFALSATISQVVTGGFRGGGPTVTLTVGQAGGTARHTFTGTAGQKVFVDVPSSTLPNNCGSLDLLDPAGKQIASGCIISGNGYIDGTVLPVAGQYTVVLDPSGEQTGEARLRVITATDQQEPIVAGGPELVATVGQPGAVSRFTFSGTAGQKVFVDVPSSTALSECGLLDLLDPAGRQISSGCVINGDGEIDRTVLPVTGTYTVVVDPGGREIGTSRLRLVTAVDQETSVTIGGAEVTATVAQAGAWSVLSFVGTAGQKVFVDVSSSTLPDNCGVLDLRGPDGKIFASGCIINGKGEIGATTLPVTGTYSLIVDPGGRAIGEARVRVRT